ncbi:MAG TPA: hypothetical protein VGN37_16880 [Actinocatenispora sp.]
MGANGGAPGQSLTGGFEVVLWGYDRHQVDQCMTQIEDQLTALYDEQQRAIELAAELQRSRSEIVDLRARLAGVPVVHHVGGKVEEILTAAEQQAVEIRATADRHLAAARDDAVQIMAVAKHQAARARRDCDLVLQEHRRAQQHAAAEIVAAARAEAARIVAEAQHRTHRHRAVEVPEAAPDHARPAAAGSAEHARPAAAGQRAAAVAQDGQHAAAAVAQDGQPTAAGVTRDGQYAADVDRQRGAGATQPAAERRRSRSAGHDSARRRVAQLGEETA